MIEEKKHKVQQHFYKKGQKIGENLETEKDKVKKKWRKSDIKDKKENDLNRWQEEWNA